MILFVILGSGEKITLMVFRQNTVESVKKKIWNRIGISVNKQRLEYLTKELSNDKTLEYYDIRNEGVVYLSLYMSLFVVIIFVHLKMTLLKVSNKKFTIAKVSLRMNKGLFAHPKNLKMERSWQTIIFRMRVLCICALE
ncbi:hypothetical protein C2G38_2324064 [Gigaspora rosea]|uniref:Ubiquitin-like domain-containing protein n=1 Tax=Gigaspora rosea TaxID=44941 RepID=A0A397V3W0_9GLOM|nr:hypothetical protein C2G38_2324064 [Gigaspora rosea]